MSNKRTAQTSTKIDENLHKRYTKHMGSVQISIITKISFQFQINYHARNYIVE